MDRILDAERGPIFVGSTFTGKIGLRIGKLRGKDHGAREIDLTPAQARIVAYSLLVAAERIDR